MKFKRSLAFIISVVTVFTSLANLATATTVSDIAGHWAEGYIQPLIDREIINGYEDGTFRPENPITRAEFCTIITKSLVYDGIITGYSTKTGSFNDVSDDLWSLKYIETAFENNFVGGKGDRVFDPEANITREEMAKIISLVYCKKNNAYFNELKDATNLADYNLSDLNTADDWAMDYIKVTLKAGLMNGNEDATFSPLGQVTRAETATVTYRILGITPTSTATIEPTTTETATPTLALTPTATLAATPTPTLTPTTTATTSLTPTPIPISRFVNFEGSGEINFSNDDLLFMDDFVGKLSSDQSPIYFEYMGKTSVELLKTMTLGIVTDDSNADFTKQTVTFSDTETALQCIVDIKQYKDFPSVEWKLRFKNNGDTQLSPVSAVKVADYNWDNAGTDYPSLLSSQGSGSRMFDFFPQSKKFKNAELKSFRPIGGRSSNNIMPYFNLSDNGKGMIFAVGWSGDWQADFKNVSEITNIQIKMPYTNIALLPNEEFRTPAVLNVFYQKDPIIGQNIFRRVMLKYYTPKDQTGNNQTAPIKAPFSINGWGGSTAQSHIDQIKYVAENKNIGFEYYWIDAGWYGGQDAANNTVDLNSSYTNDNSWTKYVGDWEVNPVLYPDDGLKRVSDLAHANGLKFLLWIEPERAVYGTPITLSHPEYFLGEQVKGYNMLLNLGDPDAYNYIFDVICNLIDKYHIDCLRQDFNMDPITYWKDADANRKGIIEIRYIEGFYRLWDELLAKYPGLVIDNCASGGRRLDYEAASRSIPLWRSDYQCDSTLDPLGGQAQTYGLNYWIPLSGTGEYGQLNDTYFFRCNMSAGVCAAVAWNATPDQKIWYETMLSQSKRARAMYNGDYYPLTSNTIYITNFNFMSFQWNNLDTDEGMILTFREATANPDIDTLKVTLGGLKPGMRYEFENIDTGVKTVILSDDIIKDGYTITVPNVRGSNLIFYKMVKE